MGDGALSLLRTESNKLLMQWQGSYGVIGRVGINDYRVKIGDTRKLFHINMMKRYHERSDIEPLGLSAVVEEQPECENGEDYPISESAESFGDVNICDSLSANRTKT